MGERKRSIVGRGGGENCFFNVILQPPRLKYPIPFSYILPFQDASNQHETLVIDVIDDDYAPIAQILLPFSLLSFSSQQSYDLLDVFPVPDSDLYSVNGSNVWGNASYSDSILSSVLNLDIPGTPLF